MNNNTSKILLFLFCLFTIFISCDKKNKPDPNNDCWKNPGTQLKFLLLSGPNVDPPSKVSIFFKLDDAEGAPIPRLSEEDFSFFEQGINDECPTLVSIDEADRKIKNSPQVFQYNTVLVLDLSGSVINSSLEELKMAANSFIDVVIPDTLNSGFGMGIWWFDGEDRLNNLVPLTDDISELKAGITSIDPSISNDNSTDLFGAVIKSVEATESILSNIATNVISSASIVLFTDGRDRAQRYTRQQAYDAVDDASNRITIFTIGLGNEINLDDLRSIGKDGFKQAEGLESLIETFSEVGDLVVDEANSYYNFEYCSPIRNGNANLIIQAKSDNKQGYLEISYDGTGFSGGCEL